MTGKEALEVLAKATEPQMVGQITRAGYIQIQEALVTLAKALQEPEPEPTEEKAQGPEAAKEPSSKG